MPASRSFALRLVPVVLAALASVACGSERSSSFLDENGSERKAASPSAGNDSEDSAQGSKPSTPNTSGAAQRAIAEADIVQLQNGRLYALSKTGSLAIVDVSKPNALSLLGQVYLPGEPFEMYLNGDRLTLMMNGVYSSTGQIVPASTAGAAYQAPAVNSSAGILVLDVRDPGLMQRVGTFAVPGKIADSRLVGDVLYLVTGQNTGCWSCSSANSTLVTTFDLATPTALKQVAQLAFSNSEYGASPESTRSIIFGNGHLWVGSSARGTAGAIDLVDVSDPKGTLVKGAHIDTAGPILSRWQMSEKDNVLRVISQQGNAQGSTFQDPEIETFTVWNPRSVQPMGHLEMHLPRPESLKAVRFDADRAYAITFRRTDPLFIIDLSDPAQPRQRGELQIPGYVVHLEPRGNRLIGLGVDDSDATGQLNVSLFDVENMDAPRMLSRVGFGGTGWASNEQVQAGMLPEDQDRIQKAFKIHENGLITIPYSHPTDYSCTSGGAVQLVNWNQDTLTREAQLPVAGNPRRALLNQNQLVAVSDSNITSFDVTSRAAGTKTADLVIGTCELRANSASFGSDDDWRRNEGDDVKDNDGGGYYSDRGAFQCTASRGVTGSSGWAAALVGLGLVVASRRARRRAA